MASIEDVEGAVLSVRDKVDVNEAERWFTAVNEAHQASAGDWDQFKTSLTDAASNASFASDVPETFIRYMDELYDQPEVLRMMCEEQSIDEIRVMYETQVEEAKKAESQASSEGAGGAEGEVGGEASDESAGGAEGEAGGEASGEGAGGAEGQGGGEASGQREGGESDEKRKFGEHAAAWYEYLTERSGLPGWSGDDGDWDEFKEQFLQTAEGADVLPEAKNMIKRVERSSDKVGAFAEFGIKIGGKKGSKSKGEKSDDSKAEDEKSDGSKSESPDSEDSGTSTTTSTSAGDDSPEGILSEVREALLGKATLAADLPQAEFDQLLADLLRERVAGGR